MPLGVHTQLVIPLNIVSPMLLRGAKNGQNDAPDLRAPAFRGAMRYWLRACAGGVIGDANLQGLHQLETAIFGDTKTGSPVIVRVDSLNLGRDTRYILPHHFEGPRSFFTDGSVTLLVQARQLMTEEKWQAIIAVTRLFIAMGAVGSRSRRGYGGLQPNDPAIGNLDSWINYIQATVSNAVQAVGMLAAQLDIAPAALPAGPCAFPCANQLAKIRLLDQISNTPDEAVLWFMHNISMRHDLGEIQWIGYVVPHTDIRQASPMHARVVKMRDGYRTQLVTLPSRFNHANYHELNAFIDNLPGTDIRVEGWNQ